MADQKKATTPLTYLRQELSVPGQGLGDFGREWRDLSQKDRDELMEAAQKEMDNQS